MPASYLPSRRSDTLPVLPEALLRKVGAVHRVVKLGEGTGYQSWRLDSAHGPVVWRVPGPDQPGSDRLREHRILRILPESSRAPRLLWTCEQGQLQSFTAGRSAHQATPDARQRRVLLEAVLSTWSADTGEPAYDYPGLVREYQRLASSPRADALAASLLSELQDWPDAPPCLTHHDLHAGNVVLAEAYPDICLLDWEYAAPGNPWLDAAALDQWLQLSADDLDFLLPVLHRFALPGGDSLVRYRHWLSQLESLWWLASDRGKDTDNRA